MIDDGYNELRQLRFFRHTSVYLLWSWLAVPCKPIKAQGRVVYRVLVRGGGKQGMSDEGGS
jgi:hypothetical protein